MDTVYRIDWDDESCKSGHNGIIARAWSTTNLFAFTTEKVIDGKSQTTK